MPLNVLNDIDGLRVFITRRQNFKYSNEELRYILMQNIRYGVIQAKIINHENDYKHFKSNLFKLF